YAGVRQGPASTQPLKWSHRVDGIAEQRDIGGLQRLNRNRRENGNSRYTFLIGSSYQTSQYWMPVVRHLLRRDAHPPRFGRIRADFFEEIRFGGRPPSSLQSTN